MSYPFGSQLRMCSLSLSQSHSNNWLLWARLDRTLPGGQPSRVTLMGRTINPENWEKEWRCYPIKVQAKRHACPYWSSTSYLKALPPSSLLYLLHCSTPTPLIPCPLLLSSPYSPLLTLSPIFSINHPVLPYSPWLANTKVWLLL